jgi:hypothetical protein
MKILQTKTYFSVNLVFDIFKIVKKLFDHFFEHNFELIISIKLRLTGENLKKVFLHSYSAITQYWNSISLIKSLGPFVELSRKKSDALVAQYFHHIAH